MEEIIKLDKKDLSAIADLYRKAFVGEPWNDDWSDRAQLENYIKDVMWKNENYDEEIENTTVKLLFHLINNFHYLIYDDNENKVNSLQFQRYHRITKFIYNNYDNKISLGDIAEKEFLSSYYLSHEIKNMSGLSFKDFLNMIRVDESVKLLLGTDKTILDISEEVGFSHSRYYNKHFKKHYNLTPLQYRKKYYLTPEKYELSKKFKEFSLSDSFKAISNSSLFLIYFSLW